MTEAFPDVALGEVHRLLAVLALFLEPLKDRRALAPPVGLGRRQIRWGLPPRLGPARWIGRARSGEDDIPQVF